MDKIHAKISKLEHRGKRHIKVAFPVSPTSLSRIKAVEGRKFSRTHRCWYIPNTFKALASLKQYFEVEALQPLNQPATVVQKQKEPPNSFKEKKLQFNHQQGQTFKVFTGNKILLEKVDKDWIKAFLPFDKKGWIEVVRNIPGRKWDTEGKFWRVPYVKDTFQRFRQFIGKAHLELNFKVAEDIPEAFSPPKKKKYIKQPTFQLNKYQKNAITAFEEQLLKEHKAWRTIKTYKGLFTHFVAYFPNTAPSKISKAQIEKYIVYKKQENASDSQMNQLINCLNCFFIRILEQEEKVVRLERPKKKKKLPNVFSLEEIDILNAKY